MPGGRTAIADGMNGRALVLDREHRVECELTHYRVRGRAVAFGDLHQVAAYPLGGLLVVDSDANAVLVLDESGIVEREWRAADDVAFADPHHALALPDGRVIVADSGNDRIVLLDPAGRCVWRSATEGLDEPLSWPRCTGRDGGLIFVVDSDNARVVAFDGDGAERLSYGPLLVPPDAAPGAVPELRMPKWVDVTPDGRHVLADYHNSRIIVLRPRVAEHLSKGAVAWA
jgi:DNA-binding beta-propeller fold protein YncE